MAQDTEIHKDTPSIARAKKRKWGYDPEQVDEFLEQAHARYESDELNLTQKDIQNVSFDLTKGGYVISQVDGTLERLERAVVDKQTSYEISANGRVAWKAQTEDLFRQIAAHASRAEGERFAAGRAKSPSYDRKQVDRLVDRIVDKASLELGEALPGRDDIDEAALENVKSSTVANTVFTQRKGKRGYDERQVDYFLNACVQLLSRIESYERIADFVTSDPEEPRHAAPAAGETTSLFDAFAAAPQPAEEPAPSLAPEAPQSFDDVQQAEQAIFAPAASAAASAASVGTATASQPPANAPLAADTTAVSGAETAQTAAAAMPPSFAPASSAHAATASGAVPSMLVPEEPAKPTIHSIQPITPAPRTVHVPVSEPERRPSHTDIFAEHAAAPAPTVNTGSSSSAAATPAFTAADAFPAPAPASSASSAPASSSAASVSSAPIRSGLPPVDLPESSVLPSFAPSATRSSRHASASSAAPSQPAAATAAPSAASATPAPSLSDTASSIQIPEVPKLANITIPDLPPFHRTDGGASAQSQAASQATSQASEPSSDSTSFEALRPLGRQSLDVEIPDLSFPSFGDDDADGKRA